MHRRGAQRSSGYIPLSRNDQTVFGLLGRQYYNKGQAHKIWKEQSFYICGTANRYRTRLFLLHEIYIFARLECFYNKKGRRRRFPFCHLPVPKLLQINGPASRQPGFLRGQGNVVALHGICQGGGARGGRGPLNQHFQEVLHNAAVSAAVAL